MQTGSSETLIGRKSGKATYVPQYQNQFWMEVFHIAEITAE